MILAAGRGERLKPITDKLPKALCPIANIPIIDYHLNKLATSGFTKIVINHAYLGWKIREHIRKNSNLDFEVIFSAEPPGGYETGGGIFHAIQHFADDPFVVINADIFSEYDFADLKLPSASLAHLVLVENPINKAGDFGINNLNMINNNKEYTFAGIACYSPKFFVNQKLGRYSVTPLLRSFASANKISGEIYSGSWVDIGTADKLSLANEIAKNSCQP